MSELVLVTGGSGHVASFCILQLLGEGYTVRTTVRSLSRENEVRGWLTKAGAKTDKLSFFAADLMSDAGWAEAVKGCDYVLHVASPFPPAQPKNEDELIIPARDGALRVLRAARDAGVKRVVLTSSFAAVGYSGKTGPGPFTEANWTNPSDGGLTAYVKSKTIAEKTAWDFIAKEGGRLELSVVNPVGIMGPLMAPDLSTSIGLMKSLLTGAMPALAHISTSVVDVRDVADLHVRAMKNPAAKGERFLAVAGPPLTFPEIADLMRLKLGERASRIPHRILADWTVRLLAVFVPAIRQVSSQLGRAKDTTGEKATRLLGWSPRSNEEALLATAESLLALEKAGN